MCQFVLTLHPLKLYWCMADDDTAMVGEEDGPHLNNEETLSQGTVSLPDITASDDEDTRKAVVHKTAHKSDVLYGNWEMNKSAREMKVLPSGIRGLMSIPMSGNLARLQTKSVLP